VRTTAGPPGARLVVRRAAGTLSVEAIARDAGVHPELVRRLVALGFLDASPGNGRVRADAAGQLARAVRLRRDLGLNYAGALLAGELLDRIELLERRLRALEPPDPRRR
jgi:hypothetical protein